MVWLQPLVDWVVVCGLGPWTPVMLETVALVTDVLGLVQHLAEDIFQLSLDVVNHGLELGLHAFSQGPELFLDIGSQGLQLLLDLGGQGLQLGLSTLQEGPFLKREEGFVISRGH